MNPFEALSVANLPRSADFDCKALGSQYAGILVSFAVLSSQQSIDAGIAAKAYITEQFGDGWVDDESRDDARAVEVLYRATKRGEATAFPSSQWLREHMTSDQLGVLLHAYNLHYYATSPIRSAARTDDVMALASQVSEAISTDAAHSILVSCSRAWLAEAFIALAKAKCAPTE